MHYSIYWTNRVILCYMNGLEQFNLSVISPHFTETKYEPAMTIFDALINGILSL